MKKSLSLLLAIAMVFTMFSGVAFAADNGSDSKAKLYDAGVLKGSLSGDTMDDATWTRQNVSVLLSRLYGVEEEAQATEKGHSFTDVTDSYYDGFITWAVEEGLFTGHSDVRFGYNEDITAQQFATVLLRALGVEFDYENAIEAAVEAGILSEELDNDSAVLRGASYDILVAALNTEIEDGLTLGASLELVGFVPEIPAMSADATGAREVTVSFNKAVDTEEASLSLKKGSVSVATDTTWSEDSRTATLALKNVKVSEGTYTVSLTGVDAANNTAEFTATNETVTNIEFVTTSDEIAFTAKAKVKVRAENQYGELASFPSSSYEVFTGYNGLGERVTKDDDGYLVIELNTNAGGGTPILTQGVSQVPLTVYFNDTRVTASKTFKIGTAPFVTKVELGETKYEGTKTSLTAAGDIATLPVRLYDQYGNPITKDQGATINFNEIVLPHSEHLTADTQDFDNDNYYETRVTLGSKVSAAAAYNVTVYAGGSSAVGTVNVGAGKVATTLGFGEFDDVLAAGDNEKKYIPLLAYDSEGNQLTPDEIVDNTNYDRINVNVNGPVTTPANPLVKSGPNKGKIEITSVNAGSEKNVVFITANISKIDANDFKQMSLTIQDARIPETLVVDKKPATKAVLGASSEFKIHVHDQYGKKLDDLTGHRVEVSLVNLDGTTPGITVVGKDGNKLTGTGTTSDVLTATATGATPVPVLYTSASQKFNDPFEFKTTPNVYGKAQFKAELIKIGTGGSSDATLRTVSHTIESIDPEKVDLTYSIKNIGELYAALDSNLLPTGDGVSAGTVDSKLAKKIEISVKDSAGNDVAFPDDKVRDFSASNSIAVKYGKGTGGDANKFFVLGDKAGTSTVTATVYSAKGEIVSATGTVTVKSDQVTVEEISAGNGDEQAAAGTYDAYALMDLKVVDNYGIEYKTANIDKYKALIGVTYSITGVKEGAGGGSVTINNATNQITIAGDVTEFLLTAHAPNGKTTSTLVYK